MKRPGKAITSRDLKKTFVFAGLLVLAVIHGVGQAEDSQAPTPSVQTLNLASDQLQFQVPGSWKKVKPRSRIIDYEFSIPAAKGETQPGRMTITSAGGGIAANLQRWRDQFTPPANTTAKEAAKTRQLSIAGLDVHVIDLKGTFHDRRGPFAPATDRPRYRMLGAVIETPGAGLFFVKFYGPQPTIDQNAKTFRKMLDSLQWGKR
jgi:hypothetical protein